MRERYFKDDGEVLYLDSGNEEAVKAAQRFLNENGYTDGYGRKLAEDGIFGKNTYNAVIKYQQDNNLQVDGKIGDETWSSMWNKEAEKYDDMKYDIPKAKEPEADENTTAGGRSNRKRFNPIDIFNIGMTYWGLKKKEQEKGNGYNGYIYSPDGYVEQVERENALRDREEPVTKVPADMAEYLEFGDKWN